MEKVAVELERVPETLLWTLYHRAVEARRPDALLGDPTAVELVERIDFAFEERFGAGEGFSQALRALLLSVLLARFA
jgi:O-methyltransferase involved in polyketide biosynthesis